MEFVLVDQVMKEEHVKEVSCCVHVNSLNIMLLLYCILYFLLLFVVVSCPTNLKFSTTVPIYKNGSYGLGRSLPFGLLAEDVSIITSISSSVLPCSGHGRCLTMREAGAGFDGM